VDDSAIRKESTRANVSIVVCVAIAVLCGGFLFVTALVQNARSSVVSSEVDTQAMSICTSRLQAIDAWAKHSDRELAVAVAIDALVTKTMSPGSRTLAQITRRYFADQGNVDASYVADLHRTYAAYCLPKPATPMPPAGEVPGD